MGPLFKIDQWLSGARDGVGRAEGSEWGFKRDTRSTVWQNCFVSWQKWWSLKSTHVIKLYRTKHPYTHTQTNACKTAKIWIRWMDSCNANFLVVILYYSYDGCYNKGKLDKNFVSYLCIISYSCMWISVISKYVKLRKKDKTHFLAGESIAMF